MDIFNAFPTPVGTFEFEDSESLNKGLSEFLYNVRDEDINSGNLQRSMGGPNGYHTKEDIMTRDNPFIKEFHKLISGIISDYYSRICDIQVGENSTMVSWGMIYGSGAHSRVHTHPGVDLSTSYYCKVPDGLTDKDGVFNFIDPRAAARWDRNFDFAPGMIVPKEGTGAIFPSWLDHYVNPHYCDGDRICIATNVFIDKGTY